MDRRATPTFERFDQAELRLCRYLNRGSDLEQVSRLFKVVGWLGDGWFWVAMIGSLPWLYGSEGLFPAAHLAVTGLAGVAVYKAIKNQAARERPFIADRGIRCVSPPLDQYSFPSGHTLHAVSFTLLMTHYFPEWAQPLALFALLVAFSRVILGLHYPTDVAAGGLLGAGIALVSLGLWSQLGY